MRRRLVVIYLSVNVMSAIVVWYAAHRVAAVKALEQRVEADSVDGITFFANSAPALLIGIIANVAWMGKVLFDVWQRHDLRAVRWLAAAIGVWGAAIVTARLF